MNLEYTTRFSGCPMEDSNKYLWDRLVKYKTALWCKEALDDSYFYTHYDKVINFNTCDVFYLNETIQSLISSNNKVKIDLALNMINSLYGLKI